MSRLGEKSRIVVLVALVSFAFCAAAESTNVAPDFKEIYDLVRAHSHLSGAELNRAAVNGLVAQLSPQVALVTNGSMAEPPDAEAALARSKLLDRGIVYARVRRVEEGLAPALQAQYRELAGTNKLSGLVLDLRYAHGTDYGAAAALADLFLSREQPLLNWGSGMVHSKEKNQTLAAPVAVLVNQETRGAAEALAAVLRETGVGLLLGTNTAGQAMIVQDFSLHDGEQLRIATAPIQLGDGSTLTAKGVKPDIVVNVSPQDERKYYVDVAVPPTNSVSGSGGDISGATNNAAPVHQRLNEAELVRERRENTGLDDAFSTNDLRSSGVRPEEADAPVVNDPALARALDLLKGLAVVRASRS